MLQIPLSPDWLSQVTTDPYAVLGVSVTADEQRVVKRYRAITRVLHPDAYDSDQSDMRAIATELLAKAINPAYDKIRHDKDRADTLALLRSKVRQLLRNQMLHPKSDLARQLLTTVVADVDVFYEQAIAELAQQQHNPFVDQFEPTTLQISELNLVYLSLKVGEFFAEKRTGLAAAIDVKPIVFPNAPPNSAPSTINYAQRHYKRAQDYMQRSNYDLAIKELKDALQIESQRSEFHSLLAQAYYMQNLPGMARVHFKRALQLNPNDALALKYTKVLKINPDQLDQKKQKPGNILRQMFARKP